MHMLYAFKDERFAFIGIKHVYLHQHSFTFSLLIQFDDILLRTYLVSKTFPPYIGTQSYTILFPKRNKLQEKTRRSILEMSNTRSHGHGGISG